MSSYDPSCPFHPPDRPEESLLQVRARRGFWWHGRYDVTDARRGELLGALGRKGQIEDASSRQLGCVRNAEPVRRKFLKSLLTGVMDAATTGDGATATLPGGRTRIEVAGCAAGQLQVVEWPFARSASTAVVTPPKRSWLNRLGRTIAGRYQSGWLLDFSMDGWNRLDSRVRLAAAVLHVHRLNRWGT
jgi:hypothetical protein